MNKLNLIIVSLLILILIVLAVVVILAKNIDAKIDRNQERILNNQNAIYQIFNK